MGLWESIPPEYQDNLTRIWTSPKKRAAAMAVLLMVAIIGLYASFGPVATSLPSISKENAIRRDDWQTTSDYDIVLSHYNEDLNIMRESIESVRSRLPSTHSKRVIIYSKGSVDQDGLQELLDMSDEVVQIPNVGREGETYLSHIVRHYDTASTNIAGHTIFMQPHVAWWWVFLPRLEKVLDKNTGFLSFGPYITHICGNDTHGQFHPRMADIYSMFQMDFCPPEPVLGTWAGQFTVSRHRILENPFKVYANLRQKFHEPKDHWIFKEGWWNNEPSNPTLGHALERSWPMIFNCTDPLIEKQCDENVQNSHCQCTDG
ncbi:uncharacterized protein I206_105159 [Kwoniella pini CBS 10737]|uniref:Uncharacterized protein n=1 Tax=Kwoniella pini CBS 10737 TaxID=1296096 RepID=A0A1B9I510_9TREE|nr:uncharacterized protein I206_03931 [Kwoniella pini CBS 10737]OCF50606.1 hypothetical protein I206_03931 [Kwoniella pini CBS 10737]